jgi:hypothetical protein
LHYVDVDVDDLHLGTLSFLCLAGEKLKVNQLGASIAGVTSGVLEAVIICPAEFAKVRLQDPKQRAIYNGTLDLVTKVFREEGALSVGIFFLLL